MSVEQNIDELWVQLKRCDLRGIIAVTNGPIENDVDITDCVENVLNELARVNLDYATAKAFAHEPNTLLDCGAGKAHTWTVKGENEQCCLPEALHGLQVELVRTTGELRSLLLVLSKLDLGIENRTNMKISELAGSLNEVKAGALKGFSEVRNRIDAADARIVILEKSLADADIPAEAEAALADLKVIAKQLDDIVPDPVDLPPVPTPLPTPA